jgi:hypothetical protein
MVLGGEDFEDFTTPSADDHIKLYVPSEAGDLAARDFTPRHLRVDQQSPHAVAPAKDRVGTLQIIEMLGECVLNHWLADSRIGGIARPITHPYQLSCPANSDYPPMISQRIADQQYWIFLRHEPRTRADSGLSFPRPKLTERLAILLKILHGEVVDFVLL